jgi:hypothetical protein
MIYNYVIFHKNCLDGFTGFLILHNSNSIDYENAKIFPDVPSATKMPPGVEDKNVIIIDVAYNSNVLQDIIKYAKSVVFIDHHETIKNDVENIKKTSKYADKLTVIYDDRLCGATLTWNFIHEKKKMPLFLSYIQDNDTGTWNLPDTEHFVAAIEAKYDFRVDKENMRTWEKLFADKTVTKLIKRGRIYYEYVKFLVKSNKNRYSVHNFPSDVIYSEHKSLFSKPGQYKVAVYCGSGCPSATALARQIMKNTNCDFVIMWVYIMDKKKYVLTFRSRDADVGAIAKVFGGGGHKLAASCSITSDKHHIYGMFID